MTSLNKVLPKILAEHCEQKSTGILILRNGFTSKTVHFDSGQIAFATSNINEERLGERLIEWNAITEEMLRIASEVMRKKESKLGKTLIELGFLEEPTIKTLISKQIKEIVFSTFQWEAFEAVFEKCQLPDYEFKLQLPIPSLIVEGFNRVKDLAWIKQKIGNSSNKLYLSTNWLHFRDLLNLDSEQAFLISCLERSPQTVAQLTQLGTVKEETVLRTVAALTQLNLIADTEKPGLQQNGQQNQRKVMEFYYEIEAKLRSINSSATHYEVLESPQDAPFTDLSAAYTRLTNKFHPNRQAELTALGISKSDSLDTIFKRLTEAIQTLINPQSRQAYDQQLGIFPRTFGSNNNLEDNSSEINYDEIDEAKARSSANEFCNEIRSKVETLKNGATYYNFLELARSASKEEIEKSYVVLAGKFHIVRQMELSPFGIDMRPQLEEISSALRHSLEVLSDQKKRELYDKRLEQENRRSNRPTEQASLRPPSYTRPSSPTPVTPYVAPTPQKIEEKPSPPPVKQQAKPFQAQPLQAKPFQPVPKPAENVDQRQNLPATEPAPEDSRYNLLSNSGSAPGKNRASMAAEQYMRSIELYDNQQYEQAANLLRQVVKLCPKDSQYWNQLGRVYSKMPKFLREAEMAYKEAIKLDPDDPDYKIDLGLFYKTQSNFVKAIELLEQALELNPRHPLAKSELEQLQDTPKGGSKMSNLLNKLWFS